MIGILVGIGMLATFVVAAWAIVVAYQARADAGHGCAMALEALDALDKHRRLSQIAREQKKRQEKVAAGTKETT